MIYARHKIENALTNEHKFNGKLNIFKRQKEFNRTALIYSAVKLMSSRWT